MIKKFLFVWFGIMYCSSVLCADVYDDLYIEAEEEDALLFKYCNGKGYLDYRSMDEDDWEPTQAVVICNNGKEHIVKEVKNPTVEPKRTIQKEENTKIIADSSQILFLGQMAYNDGSFATAKVNFEVACSQRNKLGCYMLGKMFHKGEGTKKNEIKAQEYFKKSCSLGYDTGCDKYKQLAK